MRATIPSLLSAALLLAAAAPTAQTFPCDSVAPEVREQVRQAGACRDGTQDATAGTTSRSESTVTVRLSDGTVVRVPREISSTLQQEQRLASKRTTQAAASNRSAPAVSTPTPAPPPRLSIPEVVGRNVSDVIGTLSEFKVDRVVEANAAPSGQVLAQDPAPTTLLPAGSTITLKVSDGSLAAPVTAPTTAATSSPTPAGATTNTMPAPPPAAEPKASPSSTSRPASTDSTSSTPPRIQLPFALAFDPSLVIGVGALLVVVIAALAIHQWRRRRARAREWAAALASIDDAPASQRREPALSALNEPSPPSPAAPGVKDLPSAGIRFKARLELGETRITMAPVAGGGRTVTEKSSGQYA